MADGASSESNPRHAILRKSPVLWASVGVLQTLLTAGIVFGWASLLPILRDEGVYHTPQEFATIFTAGAVGNYLSTLLFGITLDRFGPRVAGVLASLLFALGLLLCSDNESYSSLLIGFGLLGFSGPGIQMPTLHLANLFPDGGGSALYMSSQAAAFDGGTIIFAIVRFLYQAMELPTTTFFRLYLIVPAFVLVTALLVWPDDVLETEDDTKADDDVSTRSRSPYIGAASPFRSSSFKSQKSPFAALNSPAPATATSKTTTTTGTLVNAPLGTVLRHPSFWALATWVSIHILKLNFVVATVNDQLEHAVDKHEADYLIDVFGAMLPFGFVALPLVAWLLNTSVNGILQLANIVGLAYGAILVWCPSSVWQLSFIVFPAVATSRQMVYSTVFHQIGAVFGFSNYGVLLGITNILVSSFSMLQNPLVNWSEQLQDYTAANSVLLALTLPLFFVGFWANPTKDKPAPQRKGKGKAAQPFPDEESMLIPPARKPPRSYSATQLLS